MVKRIKKVKKMNTRPITMLFLLSLLLVAGCSPGGQLEAQKLVDYNAAKYDGLEATGTLIDGVRVIEIKAYQFYFEPTTIIVNKGERVRLIISTEDVPHGFEIEGFALEDYDIDTRIRPGFPLEIEFDADESGVWTFICTIYCGFGHSTMRGTLVVK